MGIGGGFDSVAALARRALLRPLDSSNGDEFYAHLRDAFALKEMADQNRRLDQEVKVANRELADLNGRLQSLLSAQREQNEREVGSRESAQELLDAVRQTIRQELRGVQLTKEEAQDSVRAGDVDESVLGFLLALQEGDEMT